MLRVEGQYLMSLINSSKSVQLRHPHQISLRGRETVSHWPHKPEIVGSTPTPATKKQGMV